MSVPRKSVTAKMIAEGRCRTCDATENLTKHHLIPESWFRRHPGVQGRHNPRNLVPLCCYCHRVVDGQLGTPIAARRMEKRRALRATLLPIEVEFVAAVRGWPWLDHHYPVATFTHDTGREQLAA